MRLIVVLLVLASHNSVLSKSVDVNSPAAYQKIFYAADETTATGDWREIRMDFPDFSQINKTAIDICKDLQDYIDVVSLHKVANYVTAELYEINNVADGTTKKMNRAAQLLPIIDCLANAYNIRKGFIEGVRGRYGKLLEKKGKKLETNKEEGTGIGKTNDGTNQTSPTEGNADSKDGIGNDFTTIRHKAATVLCIDPKSIPTSIIPKISGYAENEFKELIGTMGTAIEKMDRARQLLPIFDCLLAAYKCYLAKYNKEMLKFFLRTSTDESGRKPRKVPSRRMIDNLYTFYSEDHENGDVLNANARKKEVESILDILSNYSKNATFEDKPDFSTITRETHEQMVIAESVRFGQSHSKEESFTLISHTAAIDMCNNTNAVDVLLIPKLGIYVANAYYDLRDVVESNRLEKIDGVSDLPSMIDCLISALKSSKGEVKNTLDRLSKEHSKNGTTKDPSNRDLFL